MASVKRKIVPLLRGTVEAISAQDYEKGLKLAAEASDIDPTSEEARVAKAVCLARLEKHKEAEKEYRTLVEMAPRNEHGHYNFSILLLKLGRWQESMLECEEALAISPNRSENIELRKKIIGTIPEKERQKYAYKNKSKAGSGPQEREKREPEHTIKWIQKLEPTWTLIGWGLAVLSLVAFSILLIAHGHQFLSGITNGAQKQVHIPRSPLDPIDSVLGSVAFAGGIVFLFMDVADRRVTPIWLVPGLLFSCAGLGWVILPFYLVLGRKFA